MSDDDPHQDKNPKLPSGLKIERTLIRYDLPLLQIGRSDDGRRWLVNWCMSASTDDEDEEHSTSGPDTWLVAPVSDPVLIELETDVMSLREALLSSDSECFLVQGNNPLEPARIQSVSPALVPRDFLPKRNLTIHGKRPGRLPDKLIPATTCLQLDFHLMVRGLPAGTAPFGLVGPFQEQFQKWISASAHFIDDPTPRAVELAYDPLDWTSVNTLVAAQGSIRIVAHGTEDSNKGDRLLESLAVIKGMAEPELSSAKFRELAQKIGRDGVLTLVRLLNFVMLRKLSVTISWWRGETEDFMILTPGIANRLSRKLKAHVSKYPSNAILTVRLTAEELEKISRPVIGQGGMQSLLRKLQTQLEGDRLSMTADQVEQIVRYAQNYGSGGFQERLQGVLMEIKRLGIAFSTMG